MGMGTDALVGLGSPSVEHLAVGTGGESDFVVCDVACEAGDLVPVAGLLFGIYGAVRPRPDVGLRVDVEKDRLQAAMRLFRRTSSRRAKACLTSCTPSRWEYRCPSA